MKMIKNKGFTLAELLIVVAIIAVLVGVSIPVFSSQLEKSREATDLANIRGAILEGKYILMENKNYPAGTEYNGEYGKIQIGNSIDNIMTINISFPSKQKKSGWQIGEVDVAGYKLKDTININGKNNVFTIMLDANGKVIITFGLGTSADTLFSNESD